MLRAFGANNVKVLNGGLPLWIREEYGVESGPEVINENLSEETETSYDYELDEKQVVDLEFMHLMASSLKHKMVFNQIIDARPQGRYDGILDEPRPGI